MLNNELNDETFSKNNYFQQKQVLSVKDMVPTHYPNEGGLRHLIFHAETNGFKKCIRKIGRRVFIDLKSYYEWIDEQN